MREDVGDVRVNERRPVGGESCEKSRDFFPIYPSVGVIEQAFVGFAPA